ncbi:MAG: hypothetical protein ACOYMN_01845 [Roseimicrobium sp.]
MSDLRIRTTAVIAKVLTERTCEATLRNGKRILAFVQPLDRRGDLREGERCYVLLSLCNFNEGRIVPEDISQVRVENPVVDCL